jgi:hypothetical protein
MKNQENDPLNRPGLARKRRTYPCIRIPEPARFNRLFPMVSIHLLSAISLETERGCQRENNR